MSQDRRLVVTTPTDRSIAMSRNFKASRELVFRTLVEPELIRRWLLGPDGWSMPVCEVDLKVGGVYRYVWQRDSDGSTMGMGGVYLAIEPPARLEVTEKFDEAWYPGEALVETTLVETGGITTLTTTVLYESKEARDGVLKSDMESGVEVSYDRLEGVLAELA